MKIKHFLFILVLSVTSLMAVAQKVALTVDAPLTVEAGERFRVEYRLEGAQNGRFTPPQFTGCDVLSGPITASGSSYTIINGVQSGGVYDIYTYVLQAGSGSKITVSAGTATLDGKKYTSKALVINIVAASKDGSSAGGNRAEQSSGKVSANDVILRMSLSKNSVYKGEAIVATLKLYMRVGVSGLQSPKYPTFNGFWTQELDLTGVEPSRETLNGKVYQVQPIRQWLIYPQKSGTLEVEQSSFKATVQVVTQSSGGSSLFDNFMGGMQDVKNVDLMVTAPAIKVQVKELPRAGAPSNFSLAVGRFTLQSQTSGAQLTANAAGWVKITLDGTGDFPLIETPKFKLPAAFEQYDTKTTESLRASVNGTTGSRTWEFPFIARAEGEYTLPPIEISYFDPSTGAYRTLSSAPYKLKVLRDPTGGKNAAAVVAGLNKEELEVVGSDIRHIKRGDLALRDKNLVVLFSSSYFVALAVVVALFFAALVLLKKRIAARADVEGRQKRKASKVALSRLKGARALLDKDDRSAFFDETLRALWGYVGDKFTIATSQLNKQTVREQLAVRGVDEAVVDQFVELIERCEVAHYAPATEISMQDVYQEALTIIDKIA